MRKRLPSAAGPGTLPLPVSRKVSKELPPAPVGPPAPWPGAAAPAVHVMPRPALQVIFEGIYAHGVREHCLVAGRAKGAVEGHFAPNPGAPAGSPARARRALPPRRRGAGQCRPTLASRSSCSSRPRLALATRFRRAGGTRAAATASRSSCAPAATSSPKRAPPACAGRRMRSRRTARTPHSCSGGPTLRRSTAPSTTTTVPTRAEGSPAPRHARKAGAPDAKARDRGRLHAQAVDPWAPGCVRPRASRGRPGWPRPASKAPAAMRDAPGTAGRAAGAGTGLPRGRLPPQGGGAAP